LELQRKEFENNVSKACILTLLEMIWNCKENFDNKDVKWFILTPDDSWNDLELQRKDKKHCL